MGYSDIYCVICGIQAGPAYYSIYSRLEELKNILDKGRYNVVSKKTHKTLKKEKEIDPKLIKYYRKFIRDINKLKSKFNWCNKTYLVIDNDLKINNNNLITGDSGSFKRNEVFYNTEKYFWKMDNKSLICHKSCYKLLSDKLNYKLKIDDVENKLNDNSLLKSYGKVVDNYTGWQDFPWMEIILNGTGSTRFEILLDDGKKIEISKNIDFLMDPLKNKRNQDRILKIWKPITNKKITKKKKTRPSPSESATLYKVDKKKKGNDGNMYIIVINKNGVKRWKKV